MDKFKKHILFYTDSDTFSGSENMISNFLNSGELQNYYNVSLCFRFSNEYLEGIRHRITKPPILYPLKLRIFQVHMSNTNRNKLIPKIVSYAWYLAQYIPISLLNFFIIYKKFKHIAPDILHINNGGYPGSLSCRIAVVAAKFARIKMIVFVVNNQAVNYRNHYRWPDFILDKFVSKYVSIFITGSIEAGTKLRRVLKLSEEKIRIIPNGVSIRKSSETKNFTLQRLDVLDKHKIVFGVVGVMEERKGHLYLLEALKSILTQYSELENDFIVLIEGKDGVLQELVEFSKQNGLDSVVKFIGKEFNIFNLYAVIDALIFPALGSEDFPNVISEAMSVGKAVISTNVSGANVQVIDDVTGLLVEAGSNGQLVNAILSVIQNPSLLNEMGNKGQQRYTNNFTAEQSVNRYLDLYLNLEF